MKPPKTHVNFEVLSYGLEPLTQSEILEKQQREQKRKRASNAYKIRRKKPKSRLGKSNISQKEPSKRELSFDLTHLTIPSQAKGAETENKEEPPKSQVSGESEELDIDDFERGQSRWVIPSGWKLVLYVKFWSSSLIETSDLFTFDSYEGIFNGFHKGFPLRVRGQTSYPVVDQSPHVIFRKIRDTRNLRIVKNCFILSENVFEFGPLFVRHEDPTKNKTTSRNSTIFTFKNKTTFSVEMNFAFLKPQISNDPPPTKGNKKNNEDALANDLKNKEVFSLEHNKLLIEPGETRELKVLAIPEKEEIYRNSLICCIKENPQPMIIPLKCQGQYPRITLNTQCIDFGKLLVGKELRKQVVVKNVTLLGVHWRIKSNVQNFEVDKLEGTLSAGQEEVVTILFKAVEEAKLEQVVEIEVEDAEDRGLVDLELLNLELKAEGFFIKTELSGFDNEENFFDFGDVQVAHQMEKAFKLENQGIYPIRYSCDILRKQFKNVFRIDPNKGTLEPNEEIEIKVIFCSNGEIFLKSTPSRKEIVLKIIESHSGEVFEEHRIRLRVNSQFSQFSLNPMRSLNFSAIIFGETKTKYFQITNTGLFDFHFLICDKKDRVMAVDELQKLIDQGNPFENSQQNAKNQKNKKQVEAPNELVNQYIRLEPKQGYIPKDSSLKIRIDFFSDTRFLMEQPLQILVSNRDSTKEPHGTEYLVLGEACVPGIDTNNFNSIFEEQMVVPSLNSTGLNIQDVVNANVFATEENTFFFGQLIPSKFPEGTQERFKLSNSGKVPANVRCEVRPRVNSGELFNFEVTPAKMVINPNEFAYFKVRFKPDIMAKYSGVFEAIVENGDPNSEKHCLRFDLKGEGCLPSLLIEEGFVVRETVNVFDFGKVRKDRRKVKKLVIKNPGSIPATVILKLEKSEAFTILKTREYTLMPKETKAFEIEFGPKKEEKFKEILYVNTVNNPYEKIQMELTGEGYFDILAFEDLEDRQDTLQFEDIWLTPSALQAEPTFLSEPVKKLKNNKIIYDLTLQSEQFPKLAIQPVKVCNYSENTVRFEWIMNSPMVDIKPQIGRIGGLATREFKVRVLNRGISESRLLKAKAFLEFEEIMNVTGVNQKVFDGWDNRLRLKRLVNREDLKKHLLVWESENSRTKENVFEFKGANHEGLYEIFYEMPEPAFESVLPEADKRQVKNKKVAKGPRGINLDIEAAIDIPKIECELQEIVFDATMMYSERTFSFNVTNHSKIKIPVFCQIFKTDNEEQVPDCGYFSVSPMERILGPGSVNEFTVKFLPLECDQDLDRTLHLCMPPIYETQPLSVHLTGEAERPICHFELNAIKDENGKHLLEFECLGVKSSCTRKFYVVNPTNLGYQYFWRPLSSELKENAAKCYFKCYKAKSYVYAGKKSEIRFNFEPKAKTDRRVDEYWEFSVPDWKIKHVFHFVGHVLEPKIFFNNARADFGPLLLDGKGKEVILLKNFDNIPYNFTFSRSSLKGPDSKHQGCLSVHPLKGSVPPQSESRINLEFIPKHEKSYNYNLQCYIDERAEPLGLNVKGTGYKLHHVLTTKDGRVLSTREPNLLDFGHMFIKDEKTQVLLLANSGDFNFDYIIRKKENLGGMKITPKTSTVHKNEKVEIELSFCSKTPMTLKPKTSKFYLDIISGPSYLFVVRATARVPNVSFHAHTLDFGPIFVMKNSLKRVIHLDIVNYEAKTMNIETTFVKTPFLDVQMSPGEILLPHPSQKKKTGKLSKMRSPVKSSRRLGYTLPKIKTISNREIGKKTFKVKSPQPPANLKRIPIVFSPREVRKYKEKVTFIINNNHEMSVTILGEGCRFLLEVVSSDQVDFGSVLVGKEVLRKFVLKNNSRRRIPIDFNVKEQLKDLHLMGITLSPDRPEPIQPKEEKVFYLRFKPGKRLTSIKTSLLYKYDQDEREVFKSVNMTGSSQGFEIKILEDTLSFGDVVVGSSLVKSLLVYNIGDINAQYRWDLSSCARSFSIFPLSGVLNSSEEFRFSVKFHPKEIQDVLHKVQDI